MSSYIDSHLSVTSSEVLANGMTATAVFLLLLTLKTQVQQFCLVTSVR